MWRLVPVLVREMGQAYPELRPRRGADHRDAQARRDALSQDPGARPCRSSMRRPRALKQRRQAQGRDRLHALRHLRLSARSHPGRAAAARHRRRPRRLQRRDGAPARDGARVLGRLRRGRDRDRLVRAAREARRDRIPRLRDRDAPKASSRRSCATARRSPTLKAGRDRRGRSSTRRRSTANPAARSATPASMTADGVRFRVTDTQKKAGDLFVHPAWSRRARSRSAPRWRSRSITPAAARSGATIRRPICCTRRCARCSAITSRRRARWSRPTGCASTSRIPSR